ncbi:MFS transporter [Plantactinospora sp. S1510]|uniref:MFS transporter n=1 Tax=Plantactinospora alkalitolerans TaxID=2789879 RepID=A0ABS0H8Z2_9ACTN|nr:MFS transporter [Plantactinospora alkalitolerans]MBF9134951.1 MFS transporter [Plantactinospora alkalitolerans]
MTATKPQPTAGPAEQEAAPLWRGRDFPLFWSGQTLSALGDSFSLVAVPLLVLHATGSVARMGLLTGLAGAATIVAGIFAGFLVDRVDRRMLLICCDLARAVGYALIPLVWLVSPQLWLLYLIAPACAAIGMIFQVGYVAAVPRLVDPGQVTRANGQLYASYAAAGLAGPLLAGVLSAALGPTAAIGVDAGTFAVAALGLCLVRLRAPAVTPVDGRGGSTAVRGDWTNLLVGVRFLWRHPVLRTLTVLLSFLTFLTIGLTDIFIYHVKHDLGRPDGDVGYVLAAAAAGTVVAALLVAPVRRRLGFGTCWIGAYAVAGLAIAGAGLSGSVPALAVFVTGYAFCTATAGICSMSLRQQVTPDQLLGRVTSAFWTLHSALGPLGAAVLTVAVARYGTAPVCLTAGVVCLAIAAVATLTPIRQPRPELLPVPPG